MKDTIKDLLLIARDRLEAGMINECWEILNSLIYDLEELEQQKVE